MSPSIRRATCAVARCDESFLDPWTCEYRDYWFRIHESYLGLSNM